MNEQMQLSFHYNTTNMEGNELYRRRIKADSEARLILAFFKMHPGELFNSWDVYNALGYADPLKIISIRRAMTDLTQAVPPRLIRTEEMKMGERGMPNHTWRLA